jgi:endonuclease/exonuclease/phosphatase family metal-dependent hydrolase
MWQRISHPMLLGCIALVAACDSPSAPGVPGSTERDTVTVMTYNIFHDGENANQGISPWSARRDAVVDIIRSHAPDVLGLQEAEVWQVAWLLDQMPEYAAVARGVLADPTRVDAETVAILYRRAELGLQESGHFWYSESPDSPGSFGSVPFGELRAPRMATWVRLRRTDSTAARSFYVFNTHFAADASADDPGLARLKSAELLVQRIAGRFHADEYFFAIGDLNQPPGDWPLQYLLGGRCAPSTSCAVPPPVPEFRMIDAWETRHPADDAGTRCNATTGGDGPRVDYVLVWNPAPLAAPAISDAQIAEWGSVCPSDHRPVVATVIM